MQEILLHPLGREDHLEEGMETHPSILDWRIPMGTGAWRGVVHSVIKSRTHLKQLSTERSTKGIHLNTLDIPATIS